MMTSPSASTALRSAPVSLPAKKVRPIPSMPSSVRSRSVTTGRIPSRSGLGLSASGSSSGMLKMSVCRLAIFMACPFPPRPYSKSPTTSRQRRSAAR